MAKRLPPALEAATRDAEAASARWRAHRQLCHTCQRAWQESRPGRACDSGFYLWQAHTRTANAEARLRAPGAAQQQLSFPVC